MKIVSIKLVLNDYTRINWLFGVYRYVYNKTLEAKNTKKTANEMFEQLVRSTGWLQNEEIPRSLIKNAIHDAIKQKRPFAFIKKTSSRKKFRISTTSEIESFLKQYNIKQTNQDSNIIGIVVRRYKNKPTYAYLVVDK
ncbi:MAG: hypothetical protein QXP36_10200 [Conexivisphaerales archaeon]